MKARKIPALCSALLLASLGFLLLPSTSGAVSGGLTVPAAGNPDRGPVSGGITVSGSQPMAVISARLSGPAGRLRVRLWNFDRWGAREVRRVSIRSAGRFFRLHRSGNIWKSRRLSRERIIETSGRRAFVRVLLSGSSRPAVFATFAPRIAP